MNASKKFHIDVYGDAYIEGTCQSVFPWNSAPIEDFLFFFYYYKKNCSILWMWMVCCKALLSKKTEVKQIGLDFPCSSDKAHAVR